MTLEEKIHADRSSQQVQSESTCARAELQRRERQQRPVATAKMLDSKPREEKKTIQQRDLEEYFLSEREMHESSALSKAKHDYILDLLKSGATIEPGVHRAEIELKLKVR
jgi:hypothetical protein